MHSTLEISSHKNMTAEQILEQIQFPIENLELMLSALTKMDLSHPITGDELTALFNTIHYQVMLVTKAIKS